MIEKLKKLYNNLDLDYDEVTLCYENLKDIEDSHYEQLIQIYQENEDLSVDEVIEECHGYHKINNYTNESLRKIDDFIEDLNKLIKNDSNKSNINNIDN